MVIFCSYSSSTVVGMTIADMGTRPLIDGAAVDDFRALVARLGVMDAVNALFGRTCLPDGLRLPGRDVRLLRSDERGQIQWLLVIGTSPVDPWSHVDTAPLWVQERYDVNWHPELVVWGRPLSWEISDGRLGLQQQGQLPRVNMQRPWLTEHAADLIEPALTDKGTIRQLPHVFPGDEPDVLAGTDAELLAKSVWNSIVSEEVTENKQRLAASLRALGTHVQLAPLGLDRVDAALGRVDLLWNDLLPGETRPVMPVGGSADVVQRRGDHEHSLIADNTAFMRGWAIEAMREAAQHVPLRDRRFMFDEHGLYVREGDAWARLLGLSDQRFVLIGSSPGQSSARTGSFPCPSWVPDVSGAFGGTVAWTIRGYWRGNHFTGPPSSIPEFSALASIQPNRSLNLQAALTLVPEPVNAAAREELLGMMQGLQDFTWNGTVLAVRPPHGSTAAHYQL